MEALEELSMRPEKPKKHSALIRPLTLKTRVEIRWCLSQSNVLCLTFLATLIGMYRSQATLIKYGRKYA